MLRRIYTTLRALLLGSHGTLPSTAAAPAPSAARLPERADESKLQMNTTYEQLIRHLDEREVRYFSDDEHQSVFADFRGEVAVYRIVATVDPHDNLFQVFGYSPMRIPPGCRSAIAETVVRANFGLKVGKFELDIDDGGLRFQVSQVLTGDSLDDDVIRRFIGTTISMLDIYLPAVLSVVYGNELPQEAIRCVEPKQTESPEA